MRISELFKKAELMGLSNLQEEAEGVEMALRFLAGVTGPSGDRNGAEGPQSAADPAVHTPGQARRQSTRRWTSAAPYTLWGFG